ncbi:hypothetical protein H5P28_02980 [Ruficoccus amylovorans]|uniref:Uncharacterized protein n=1 Tax=Ruficoccus amylovorans TaxID=1804625 RepID=A0A842HBZ0_9BACT|nr:hypothetical protein [Ruficoccus amylovorans]MBC2593216.1 hypothetical protein [Ruficoccus amylovorans]
MDDKGVGIGWKSNWSHGWENRSASTRRFDVRGIGPANDEQAYETGAVLMGERNPDLLEIYEDEVKNYGQGEEYPAGYSGWTSKLPLPSSQAGEEGMYTPAGELYSLRDDPNEWNNHFDDPGHAEIWEEMTRKLLVHVSVSNACYPHWPEDPSGARRLIFHILRYGKTNRCALHGEMRVR